MSRNGAVVDDFDSCSAACSPAKRRRQQASHARFDHAAGLVERAVKAASAGDQPALDTLVTGMDQLAFDDFEERHPPAPPWTTCSMRWCATWSPTTPTPGSPTWVDYVVFHADQAPPGGVARRVWVAVGMAAEEYWLFRS